MRQTTLYSRLGQLLIRRVDCLEEIERLSAQQGNSLSALNRARKRFEKILRAIEEVNAQISEADQRLGIVERKTKTVVANKGKEGTA